MCANKHLSRRQFATGGLRIGRVPHRNAKAAAAKATPFKNCSNGWLASVKRNRLQTLKKRVKSVEFVGSLWGVCEIPQIPQFSSAEMPPFRARQKKREETKASENPQKALSFHKFLKMATNGSNKTKKTERGAATRDGARIVMRKWTAYEDDELRKVIGAHQARNGYIDWAPIQQVLTWRTAQQCRGRWRRISTAPKRTKATNLCKRCGALRAGHSCPYSKGGINTPFTIAYPNKKAETHSPAPRAFLGLDAYVLWQETQPTDIEPLGFVHEVN